MIALYKDPKGNRIFQTTIIATDRISPIELTTATDVLPMPTRKRTMSLPLQNHIL